MMCVKINLNWLEIEREIEREISFHYLEYRHMNTVPRCEGQGNAKNYSIIISIKIRIYLNRVAPVLCRITILFT